MLHGPRVRFPHGNLFTNSYSEHCTVVSTDWTELCICTCQHCKRFMASALRKTFSKWDGRIQARLTPGWREKWNHPAGPKTVHFWSPVVKWGLVIAGATDFARPVEALSLNQSLSLAVTGSIWARYCLVIIPKNYFLCSCNVFLGAVGITQVARIMVHRHKHKE